MYDFLVRYVLPIVVLCAASLTVTAAQTPVTTPPTTTSPQTTAPTATSATPAAAQTPAQATWTDWLATVRTEALSRGISQATVDAALTNLEQLPVAVERDRSQPETILTLDTYLDQHLTTKVIKSAGIKPQ